MTPVTLPNRALIALGGDACFEFLQGLITSDMSRVQKGEAIYSALLSPQGRFLHAFFIYPWQGGVMLDVAADRADDLIKRLTFYRLRSAVTIARVNELVVSVSWGEGSQQGFPDPRLQALGFRLIGTSAFAMDDGAYEAHRLQLGVPEAQDLVIDKSLILEWGFEELRGVDFSKGCYIGQEVTARMKHKSERRKFVHQIHASSDLAAGAAIMGEGEIGVVSSAKGRLGLALLKFEDVQKAPVLKIDGLPVTAALPAWAAKQG